MILPFKIRENKGSFVMALPRSIGIQFQIDKKLKENKSIYLIAELIENGVLIRHPTEEEIDRFGL